MCVLAMSVMTPPASSTATASRFNDKLARRTSSVCWRSVSVSFEYVIVERRNALRQHVIPVLRFGAFLSVNLGGGGHGNSVENSNTRFTISD